MPSPPRLVDRCGQGVLCSELNSKGQKGLIMIETMAHRERGLELSPAAFSQIEMAQRNCHLLHWENVYVAMKVSPMGHITARLFQVRKMVQGRNFEPPFCTYYSPNLNWNHAHLRIKLQT